MVEIKTNVIGLVALGIASVSQFITIFLFYNDFYWGILDFNWNLMVRNYLLTLTGHSTGSTSSNCNFVVKVKFKTIC